LLRHFLKKVFLFKLVFASYLCLNFTNGMG